MSRRVKLGLAVLASLALVGALTLVFWDFLRARIVLPFYTLLWGVVPHEIYLILLVILCLLIGSSTVAALQRRRRALWLEERQRQAESRLEYWLEMVANVRNSDFSRRNFSLELRSFIINLLAFQEGLSRSEAETRAASQVEDYPPAVRYLILKREIKPLPIAHPRKRSLFRRFWDWFSDADIPERNNLVPEDQVEEILQFIEKRLEIETHEHPQPGA